MISISRKDCIKTLCIALATTDARLNAGITTETIGSFVGFNNFAFGANIPSKDLSPDKPDRYKSPMGTPWRSGFEKKTRARPDVEQCAERPPTKHRVECEPLGNDNTNACSGRALAFLFLDVQLRLTVLGQARRSPRLSHNERELDTFLPVRISQHEYNTK